MASPFFKEKKRENIGRPIKGQLLATLDHTHTAGHTTSSAH